MTTQTLSATIARTPLASILNTPEQHEIWNYELWQDHVRRIKESRKFTVWQRIKAKLSTLAAGR